MDTNVYKNQCMYSTYRIAGSAEKLKIQLLLVVNRRLFIICSNWLFVVYYMYYILPSTIFDSHI